jgi:hypothetical protein
MPSTPRRHEVKEKSSFNMKGGSKTSDEPRRAAIPCLLDTVSSFVAAIMSNKLNITISFQQLKSNALVSEDPTDFKTRMFNESRFVFLILV